MIDNVTILSDDNVNIIDSTSFVTVYHANEKNEKMNLFYDYTKGDETNFTLTFYTALEDVDDDFETNFPVSDVDDNATKVLTSNDNGIIEFDLDSIDNRLL
ncbi:MAG: hypothetical protein ACOC1K_00070 [Nanoarchaeota archaeon]